MSTQARGFQKRLGCKNLMCACVKMGVVGLIWAATTTYVTADEFPGAGHKFTADFTKFKFEQIYTPDSMLTYTAINSDGGRGASGTVKVKTQELAKSVFMVSWQEANKATVVQIQDYTKKAIYTNLTLPDGTFIQLQGSFVPAD